MKYGIIVGFISSLMSSVWAGWRTTILVGLAICIIFLGTASIISKFEEDRQVVALGNLQTELKEKEKKFRVDLMEMNEKLREFVEKQENVLNFWEEETVPRPWVEIMGMAEGEGIELLPFKAPTINFREILYRGREIKRRNGELKEEQTELERIGGEFEHRGKELERRRKELKRGFEEHNLASTLVALWSTLGGYSAIFIIIVFLLAIYQDLRRKSYTKT